MRKTAIRSAAALAAVATLFASSSAFALKTPAGMGTQGSLTVTADRLFGFLISSTYSEPTPGVERTSRTTGILIGSGSGQGSIPRVGLDYTVIPNLTIGAAFGLGFGTGTSTTKSGGTETKVDEGTATSFLLAPRVGYLIDFSDNLGIWPRGGITIQRTSTSTPDNPGPNQAAREDTETSNTQIFATLDVPFVLAPSDHFAFTAGPFLDFPLSASAKDTRPDPNKQSGTITTEPDPSPKTTYIGIGIGLLGSF